MFKANKLSVILDCDDVLYVCNQMAVERLNAEQNTSFSVEDITKWGLFGNALDDRLKYFGDPEFVRAQRPFPGAREFVKKLSETAEILICTNVPSQCVSARYDRIREDFPEISPDNILFGGRKDLLHADLMLDDAVHNLEKASGVTYPVLFQRPWNRYNRGLLSVNNYESFLRLIDQLTNEKRPGPIEAVALVGPTGAGKNELAKRLCSLEGFAKPLMYSTSDSHHYQKVSKEEFAYFEESGAFIEVSTYGGQTYGTLKSSLEELIEDGKVPVLVLDINGAFLLNSMYKTLTVFLQAEKEACFRNIISRDIDLEEKVIRLSSLEGEMRNERICDLIVTNVKKDAALIAGFVESSKKLS